MIFYKKRIIKKKVDVREMMGKRRSRRKKTRPKESLSQDRMIEKTKS